MITTSESLSIAQARRIALGAQGFDRSRPDVVADRRHARRVFSSVQVIQIDSVNVLARAHEMPLWARLGDHRRGVLDAMVAKQEIFEYWAHEASYLPVTDWPLFAWKMEIARTGHGWRQIAALRERDPGFVEGVLDAVTDRGAVTASEWSRGNRRSGPWWDWSDAKYALEYLFWTGQVTARRRNNFEREYVLPEVAIPAPILALAPVPEAEARRILLERSARALGVATARDLMDYYRLKLTASRSALQELIDDGVVREVQVEGWKDRAYLHRDARLPRRITAASLLSPFDPVVWERSRAERLFDFRYRIEIYTPAAKRVYGYYVLPFLLGDRIVGRVDLKADRAAGVLRVPGAFTEGHAAPTEVAPALAAELHALAAWLGLSNVIVERRGDLARPLRAAL